MSRHLTAALAATLLAWLAPFGEASAQTGQSLYMNGPPGAGSARCGQGTCHGSDPLRNLNGVMSAAGNVSAIYTGASKNPAMSGAVSQYTGAQLQSIADWLLSLVPDLPPPAPPPPAPPPTSTVVEYYHAAFGHYFITNIAGEISALDSGKFAGWARTGRSFDAHTSSNGYVTAVCRFFTVAFPPKSSHFYTSNSAECRGLQASSKVWTFEAEAFYVQQANEQTGSCPTGYRAVYRLYNDGQGGAPNHRYTTDPAVRIEMMGKGWIPEGFGPEGVGFCSPN
jgi:cytochrome c553